ncbi:hypothetical protein [Amaricoccus tamworthensis]|uniref:hypothetical protein n=1 Tax=Amaricoccus tamworthensis TaxID=57002 RepID=UPI003C7AF91C
MRPRKTLQLRPIYLVYWTVAALLVGMLLPPSATKGPTGDHHGPTHIHATQEVDPDKPPEVTLTVTQDALSGWNGRVSTRNFAFAPEMVNQANVPHHGHAHLYVNGQKIARLYGPAFHIADLPKERNIISVSLNANDHSDLVLNGQPIAAEVVVMNPVAAETANRAVPANRLTNHSIETKG